MKNDQKKLFSIGEIAQMIGITRKIILNYEAKGLITPDKKEGETGNRYYTIDTFTQIRTIRVFQELGLSLDEIRAYFNEASDLRPMIRRLEIMRDKLELTIEKLKERTGSTETSIQEITIEPQTVYARSYETTTVAGKTGQLREVALEALHTYGTDTTRRMYYTELSSKKPDTITYCVAIPAESRGEYVQTNPPLRALSIFHHGAYETIPETRSKLSAYAEQNHMQLSGVFRNVFLEGPPQHKDASRFITQVLAILK